METVSICIVAEILVYSTVTGKEGDPIAMAGVAFQIAKGVTESSTVALV